MIPITRVGRCVNGRKSPCPLADSVRMDDLMSGILAVRQAETQTRIDYAVAKKMLDSQRGSGEAAVKMIEAAAESQGRLAQAIGGLGGCVDCHA